MRPTKVGEVIQIEDQPTQQQTREPSQLRQASRCLAKTRRGTPCQSPATKHGRCRMHGGAPRTGAPSGKANGNWKHGRYSKESTELRRLLRQLTREAKDTLATF